MSPELVRLLFASGLSLIVGGALGAYATRSVFGEPAAGVHPVAVREKACPECPPPPTCPPPPDCGEHGIVPTSTAPRGMLLPDPDEPERERRPGLPASAIRRAQERVQAEVAACTPDAIREGATGLVLLDITVTTTSTEAVIGEANIAGQSGGARVSEELERCLIDAARRARFEWSGGEGEAHFRLPVKLGH